MAVGSSAREKRARKRPAEASAKLQGDSRSGRRDDKGREQGREGERHRQRQARETEGEEKRREEERRGRAHVTKLAPSLSLCLSHTKAAWPGFTTDDSCSSKRYARCHTFAGRSLVSSAGRGEGRERTSTLSRPQARRASRAPLSLSLSLSLFCDKCAVQCGQASVLHTVLRISHSVHGKQKGSRDPVSLSPSLSHHIPLPPSSLSPRTCKSSPSRRWRRGSRCW